MNEPIKICEYKGAEIILRLDFRFGVVRDDLELVVDSYAAAVEAVDKRLKVTREKRQPLDLPVAAMTHERLFFDTMNGIHARNGSIRMQTTGEVRDFGLMLIANNGDTQEVIKELREARTELETMEKRSKELHTRLKQLFANYGLADIRNGSVDAENVAERELLLKNKLLENAAKARKGKA